MSPERSIGPAQLATLLGDWRAGRPAYRGLADAIRSLVLDGRLPLRTRLPAERELADLLGVSRTTVTAAYDVLRQTGHLASRRGSGSWTSLPAARSTPSFGPWTPIEPVEGETLDLAIAAPVASYAGMAAAVTRAAERLTRELGGHGYDPRGLPVVRAALAERFTRRGVPTTPDQILVTSGAQNALSLILRTFARPGDRVLVESPTYPNALDAVRRGGTRAVPVPVGVDGWDVAMVEATLRQSTPRLAYLIPDFHNPTGHYAEDEQRAGVVSAARRAGSYVVVDETLVDLGLDPVRTALPMAAHDRGDAVITIGSASKSFWGGMRIGWVRAAADTVRRITAVRATVDLASPVFEQLLLDELLAAGEAPLADRRAALAEQRAAAAATIARELPDWRFAPPAGGLALWCELPDPVSTALSLAADRVGVRVVPGPRFGAEGTLERFVRIPYTLPPAPLVEAIGRVASAYRSVATGEPTGLREPAIAV